MTQAPFPIGSVAHTLMQMRGVWHDHVEIFDLAGNPLADDAHSGSPGPAPYDNLVYIDFDGEIYTQTNVTFRGRPLHAKTFSGKLIDGILVFDRLGPEAPVHIGVSGGPGILFFLARDITEALQRYSEPDCVRLLGPGQRTRTTVLYRGGTAVRTLTAYGQKLAPTAAHRVADDPRGQNGPVHAMRSNTKVFEKTQMRKTDD